MRTLAALLLLAQPGSAFVTQEQGELLCRLAQQARHLRQQRAASPTSAPDARLLVERLLEESLSLSGGDFERTGRPDAQGRFEVISAALVEVPPEPAQKFEAPSATLYVVFGRTFSGVDATQQQWMVDPDTESGVVTSWRFHLSLEGELESAEQFVVPLDPGPDGPAPREMEAERFSLPLSDPATQQRWRALLTELLTLGRSREA